MIKKIILLILLLSVVVLGLLMVVVAPYHIYTLTLTEGVNTSFLSMKPSKPQFYDGTKVYYFSNPEGDSEDKDLFEIFHFSNFLIPFPINNSLFNFIPSIRMDSSGHRLGGSFVDGKRIELFTFSVEKVVKFETNHGDQKLFMLPVFKNYIIRHSDKEIWNNLFSKKLSLPANLGRNFFETLVSLKSVSYNDLVYNLYLLYNRDQIFPPATTKISYDDNLDLGVIELQTDDVNYRLERVFIIEKGYVYSLIIKTRKKILAAEYYRNIFLKSIKYKESTKDSAIPIYAQYKGISYTKRIDQQGMTYLFCAWSHDVENREYIRVIIYFLERGKSNLKFLKPFYEYAFKKFGTNLSSDSAELLETAEEKIKRRASEELESEVRKEEDKISNKFEGNFNNQDEKIKYYLQKAKSNKVDKDQEQKVLMDE